MKILRLAQSLGSSKGGGTPTPPVASGFTFSVNTANAGSASNQFQLPLVSSGAISMDVAWGDGTTDTITSYNQAETLHTYSASGTYTISIENEVRGWKFANGGDKLKMLDVSNWGDFNVTIGDTFWGCTNLTSSATDSATINYPNPIRIFADCPSFNGNVNNWTIVQAFNRYGTFLNATSFNQPLNNWDMSGATSIHSMFSGATSFDQDLSSWQISNVAYYTNFLAGGELSTANYDALLISWEAQGPTAGHTTTFGTSKYTLGGAAEAARASLISTYGWTITDGGGI